MFTHIKTNFNTYFFIVNTDNMTFMSTGIKKPFRAMDFWYLLIRFLHRNYVNNFYSICKQLLLFIAIHIFIVKCLNENMGKLDGCRPHWAQLPNQTCIEIEDRKAI